jgi:hypothetical protein
VAPLEQQIFDIFTRWIPAIAVIVCWAILLSYKFLNRNMPRAAARSAAASPIRRSSRCRRASPASIAASLRISMPPPTPRSSTPSRPISAPA